MLARNFASLGRAVSSPFLQKSRSYHFSITFVARYSSSTLLVSDYSFIRRASSSAEKKDIPKLKWRDIISLIDLPENKGQGLLKRIKGIKDQTIKLGGTNVVVFYFGSFFVFWGVLYVLLKNGLLPMDTLIDLLGKTSFTSKAITLVEQYPNLSYLIISNFAIDFLDPVRYLMTIIYARHVISKRYLETALENISCEDKGAKEAVASVKSTSLVDEEHKNPKIKSTRIITIKGKHNSSINM